MKKLLIAFLIFTSHIFSMNKEEATKEAAAKELQAAKLQAAQELQKLFKKYRKEEPKLKEEYQDAVTQHQRAPSPATEQKLKELNKKIEDSKKPVRDHCKSPNSEHLNFSMDVITMGVAYNIVKIENN